VIHEFGHGLSCKAFGGECHEMGALFLCLSPCLYCNVSDSWTLPSKWRRIIISFAGIYVELVIAALATFVWWYTPHMPTVNNIAMAVMVLCSVSTVVFNANPLMRFDGYYMLADWLEIPNLREKSNRFLNNLFLEKCLGVEVPPEAYMAPSRKILFVVYAIASWVYRWVVMFSILWMLADLLGPKLKILSQMLAIASLASLFIWPAYRVIKNIRQRGRLPDMKAARVYITLTVLVLLVVGFFLLPLPVSRVHETGLVTVDPVHLVAVSLPEPAQLTGVELLPGETAREGQVLARFRSPELEIKLADALGTHDSKQRAAEQLDQIVTQASNLGLDAQTIGNFRQEATSARADSEAAGRDAGMMARRLAEVRELKAPRDGVVVTIPRKDEIGKLYDKGYPENPAIIQVGDPTKLLIKVPVTPQDYRVLQDDLPAKGGELDVSILIKGRSDREFHGKLRRLPGQNATTLPIQLTQRGGGPLAVKPSDDPNQLIPLAQTYIVEVEVLDPDAAIRPGQLAVVKVHAKWRSGAWWVGKTLANALDIGLY